MVGDYSALMDGRMATRNVPPTRLWILPGLLVVGAVVAWQQPFTLNDVMALGEAWASEPWIVAGAVVVMAALFALGLPGSMGIWFLAPFHAPWLATLLMVVASVSGAAVAYALADRLRGRWNESDRQKGWAGQVVNLLARQSGIPTQTALRILPGFPHAVVNFAAGVLRLPWTGFLVSAVVGLTVKWGIYAWAIYGVADALASGEALSATAVWPLLALSVLLLAGVWARQRVSKRHGGQ
jgi:uncharacterized membrane protein YdjX (TVP38/TMEM64 family)